MVEEILHYARLAYAGSSVEARELMLDALADLLAEADTLYVDGAAALAARKARWGYEAAAEEELLRTALEYIASPSCETLTGGVIITSLSKTLRVDAEATAKMLEISASDCRVAKHMVALLLLVPPAGGAYAN